MPQPLVGSSGLPTVVVGQRQKRKQNEHLQNRIWLVRGSGLVSELVDWELL